MKYIVDIGKRKLTVEVNNSDSSLEVKVDNRPLELSLVSDKDYHRILLLINGRSYDTEVFPDNGKTSVFVLGRQFNCHVEDERLAVIREVAGVGAVAKGAEVKAPMPGLVVKLLRQKGERVAKGESIVVIEAMKMENDIKSPVEGIIGEIKVESGAVVEKGTLLLTITSS